MKYFILNEFDSPDAPGSGALMDKHFLDLIDQIREDAGIPFHINSGYRTQVHNAQVGGKPSSAHTRGYAADIQADTGEAKYLIVSAALLNGIKRIGIGKTFIHIDNDASLPMPSIWLY